MDSISIFSDSSKIPLALSKTHDIALNDYDFDTIVAGHLTRLGTRNDVMVQKEFVSDLEKADSYSQSERHF